MSTSTSTSIPEVLSQPSDNRFQLSDHENKTHVTLYLEKAGPLVQGSTAGGPAIEYVGEEGTLSFSGQQITAEDTALGKMFTVTLNVVPDLRWLSFTLLLPSVIHQEGASTQSFQTIAIKSERFTSLQGRPATIGANPTYIVIKMHGNATKIEVPA